MKGQLLLDGGKLTGSFFHRSVVLVCQHDDEGAFGLVLNRSTENRVGEMILQDLPESIQDHPLHLGGPVEPGALSYLHGDTFLPDANVVNNVNLGHSLDELVDIANAYSPSQRIQIFAGYAGWSAGQLDAELENDSWLIHPATPELIFEHASEDLWSAILRLKGWQHRVLSQAPEDFSHN